jgi:preprotein translocase subunit YajC
MDFNIFQIIIPLVFLAAVFGLGYYQKRKKTVKKGLHLVVSNSEVKTTSGAEGKPFERHLEAVKSSNKQK